jgi:3-phytase
MGASEQHPPHSRNPATGGIAKENIMLEGQRRGRAIPLVLCMGLLGASDAAHAVVVPLFYQTPPRPPGAGEFESMAVWVAPDAAQSRLFVTDKTAHWVEVYDPVTNVYLTRFGGQGSGPGQLRRPNGIAAARAVSFANGIGDVLFVVERDNDRVSMFSLPDLVFRGHFGAGVLDAPYGIALQRDGSALRSWITHDGDRVAWFDVVESGAGLAGALAGSFTAAGTLESIVLDPETQRVLLCDEGSGADVMVYDQTGNLLQRFGQGLFVGQPEGIVLYDTGGGAGYWIVADQNASPTEFEVFDRQTYASLGNWTGATHGTDGIALTQLPLPNIAQGAFFAVHSDSRGHCYRWSDVATALGLQIEVQDRGGATPQPPQLTIESPAGDVVLPPYQNAVAFSGTATDTDGAVLSVEWRAGNGGWQPAAGGATWSFTATGLAPDLTRIEVRAHDDDGLTSPVVQRSVHRLRRPRPPGGGPAEVAADVTVDGSGADFTVTLSLRGETRVLVSLYDVAGRRVATLAQGRMGPGRHVLEGRAAGRSARLPSGVYFVRIDAGHLHRTEKVVLSR